MPVVIGRADRRARRRVDDEHVGVGAGLRVAELFFDPFVDQRCLIEAARGCGVPDCLALISGKRNAYNMGALKHRFGHFLECVLEVGHVVALPKRCQFLNGVGRW